MIDIEQFRVWTENKVLNYRYKYNSCLILPKRVLAAIGFCTINNPETLINVKYCVLLTLIKEFIDAIYERED